MHDRPASLALAVATLFLSTGLAVAETETAAPAADPGNLRICASETEAPFSMKDAKGFENRLAEIIAKAMDRKPVFVWTPKPAVYLVRDFLDKNLCDLVAGVDTGDTRVLTSKPLYRSGYVFISKTDRPIRSWKDEAIKGMSRFAVGFGSPAETMLRSNGKWEDNAAYLFSLVNFKSSRNQYTRLDPARIVAEVADGHAELGVAFSPEVARYLKSSSVPLQVTMIPDDNVRGDGLPIPHHFDQSFGVRLGDAALLKAVDAAIVKARAEIDQVLADEGVLTLPSGS
jgi:mxaJ protein